MQCSIGLNNPKHAVNVGSVLRACKLFGVNMLAIQGVRYKRSGTDTFGAYKNIPLIRTNDLHGVIPYSCVPVAVELIDGACSLHQYEHPENAFYVFGGEDQTLGHKVLSWCRDVVYIPTNGCLNLACCVNTVLYDRSFKLSCPTWREVVKNG